MQRQVVAANVAKKGKLLQGFCDMISSQNVSFSTSGATDGFKSSQKSFQASLQHQNPYESGRSHFASTLVLMQAIRMRNGPVPCHHRRADTSGPVSLGINLLLTHHRPIAWG